MEKIDFAALVKQPENDRNNRKQPGKAGNARPITTNEKVGHNNNMNINDNNARPTCPTCPTRK